MYYRRAYFVIGCMLVVFGGLLTALFAVSSGTFPDLGYMFIALVVMSFSYSYLAPQFQKKDERSKLIKNRAMFYAYFLMIGYMAVLSLLLNVGVIDMAALQIVHMLFALSLVTLFVLMVIFSFVY